MAAKPFSILILFFSPCVSFGFSDFFTGLMEGSDEGEPISSVAGFLPKHMVGGEKCNLSVRVDTDCTAGQVVLLAVVDALFEDSKIAFRTLLVFCEGLQVTAGACYAFV